MLETHPLLRELDWDVEGVVRVSGVPGLPVQHGDDETTVAVEGVDLRHLLLGQLEVEEGRVLHDPGRGHRLRDHDHTPLHLPPKQLKNIFI